MAQNDEDKTSQYSTFQHGMSGGRVYYTRTVLLDSFGEEIPIQEEFLLDDDHRPPKQSDETIYVEDILGQEALTELLNWCNKEYPSLKFIKKTVTPEVVAPILDVVPTPSTAEKVPEILEGNKNQCMATDSHTTEKQRVLNKKPSAPLSSSTTTLYGPSITLAPEISNQPDKKHSSTSSMDSANMHSSKAWKWFKIILMMDLAILSAYLIYDNWPVSSKKA